MNGRATQSGKRFSRMEELAIAQENNGIDERDYFTLFVAFEGACSKLVAELPEIDASDKHTKLLMAKYLHEVRQHLCIKSTNEINWLVEDIDRFFENFFEEGCVIYEEEEDDRDNAYMMEAHLNAKQHFTRNRQNILRLKTDADSVVKVSANSPDAIVLEPTGSWYSLFWAKVARSYGIKLCWIGHGDLAAQRKSYGFINNRDDEDAYCLAMSWFEPTFINVHGEKRFLSWYEEDRINSIRSHFYDLEQLDKLRTSFINQLRQRLAVEFPEASQQAITQSVKLGYSPFIGWLAGIHRYTRIENKYGRSIVHALDINLSEYTRAHARAIVDLELRGFAIEADIDRAIDRAEFVPGVWN